MAISISALTPALRKKMGLDVPKRSKQTHKDFESPLVEQCIRIGLPAPDVQFRPTSTRRHRWDLAWPVSKLLVDVQGSVFSQGRHTSGTGYREDCRKMGIAVCLGYRCLWVTTDMVTSGEAVSLIETALSVAP